MPHVLVHNGTPTVQIECERVEMQWKELQSCVDAGIWLNTHRNIENSGCRQCTMVLAGLAVIALRLTAHWWSAFLQIFLCLGFLIGHEMKDVSLLFVRSSFVAILLGK